MWFLCGFGLGRLGMVFGRGFGGIAEVRRGVWSLIGEISKKRRKQRIIHLISNKINKALTHIMPHAPQPKSFKQQNALLASALLLFPQSPLTPQMPDLLA